MHCCNAIATVIFNQDEFTESTVGKKVPILGTRSLKGLFYFLGPCVTLLSPFFFTPAYALNFTDCWFGSLFGLPRVPISLKFGSLFLSLQAPNSFAHSAREKLLLLGQQKTIHRGCSTVVLYVRLDGMDISGRGEVKSMLRC